jgi:hypothetical protein
MEANFAARSLIEDYQKPQQFGAGEESVRAADEVAPRGFEAVHFKVSGLGNPLLFYIKYPPLI